MEEVSLQKTVSGFSWKFFERIAAQSISLIVSIILARLLTPDDYSVVGIVAIFFAFANTLISGGLNTALIQKKDADIEDYSSVLWISLLLAIIIYSVLFFSAPMIADSYKQPILVPVFRVMGISLFIYAVKSVLCAYISSHLQFRLFFFSTIIGTIVSAVVGIIMAINGCGPWALVAQHTINALVDTIILFFTTRVKFVFRISRNRSKSLFKYGWKILVTSGISVLYDEINPLIIGLKYAPADLSFYSKGRSFPQLINSTVGDSLSSVLFPVMSKIQDDKQKVLLATRKFMQISSFVIFPMMLGFLAVADSFIIVILTEKWLPASIYIQAFCIVYMLNIVQTGNLQVMRALGRSDILLILEIIKKCLYAVVIFLFVILTNKPEFLALACIVNVLIASLVNTYPNRKLIGYSYRLQILDLFNNFITSLIMCVVVYLIGLIPINIYVLLPLQILSGIGIYILLNIIICNKNLKFLWEYIKAFHKKRKNNDTFDS